MTLEQRAEALNHKLAQAFVSPHSTLGDCKGIILAELKAVVEACAKAVCICCNDPAWPLSKEDPSMHIVPHDGSWMYCKAQQIRQEVGR